MAQKISHSFTNQEIAQLFENVAAALTLKNQNRFKIIAYQNASTAAEHATSSIKDLWEEGKLDEIPGFGASMQEHLNELFTTGEVKEFEKLFHGIPKATFNFLKIPGVGPKTAVEIAELGVTDIHDLATKLKEGVLVDKLSEKKQQTLLESVGKLQEKDTQEKRMLLPHANSIAEEIMAYMHKSPDVVRIDPLGSLRRRVATIGDIDFAIASANPKKVIEHFAKYSQIRRIILQGEAKCSVELKIGVRVDVMAEKPEYYGSLLQHFTGSKFHNIHLRKIANQNGLSLSEKGIKNIDKSDKFAYDSVITAKTEEAFYKQLDMQYIPPEMREDTGEIELAQKHKVPSLVDLTDIKGDLHLHSSYPIEPSHDLGADSMEKLIDHAEQLDYEYINLTDHNPSLGNHTEQQIISLLSNRTKYIDKLKSSRSIKLLNSLEIDIQSNGDLACPVEGLKMLDLPICGVHSKHAMPRDEITKRVKAAIENPYLKVLVHPTNRLLNKRDQSDIDWDVIFDIVKKHNKVLEINAYPDRLDLTDMLVKEAVSRGIKLCIDTDSHAVEHMDNMQYGLSVARRGWATKGDIVNTWPWVEFKKFFKLEYK